jgi:16S rRNA (adenine1518-N6/adenine1519-N6)-dimethyltransferase
MPILPSDKLRHPKDILAEHEAKVKKSFGQNFLVDQHHLSAIAGQIADLSAKGSLPVFEIGSGLGALTRELVKKKLKVHAIERDRDMAYIFRIEFAEALGSPELVLHEDNASTFDYVKTAADEGKDRFVLCGNLPYHLTSTLIFRALEMTPHVSGALFMIQKEVAERIVAGPGSRDYGVLSVLIQAEFSVAITHEVPSGAFWPRPKVDSAVITMKPRVPQVLTKEEFERLLNKTSKGE